MIRFGYKASAEQFPPAELLNYGVQAERLGFDSVFVSDHLQPWRHDGGHAPAALPWLGALAARTERVLIGTSVLTPSFRYHPAVIAQAFATLGCLAPGRVVLGVGSGGLDIGQLLRDAIGNGGGSSTGSVSKARTRWRRSHSSRPSTCRRSGRVTPGRG